MFINSTLEGIWIGNEFGHSYVIFLHKAKAWWIFEDSYPHFHFVSFGVLQTQIWHIRKALNKTNVLVTKHLFDFQQPMNHTNSASPACYWLIRWEFPTFQGKWHSDLNEWKSTHLYLPLSLSLPACLLFVKRPKSRVHLPRGSLRLIATMIKVFVSDRAE